MKHFFTCINPFARSTLVKRRVEMGNPNLPCLKSTMEVQIFVSIPDYGTTIRKALGWLGFGWCPDCGTHLVNGGWYDEKDFCPHCLEKPRETPPNRF